MPMMRSVEAAEEDSGSMLMPMKEDVGKQQCYADEAEPMKSLIVIK